GKFVHARAADQDDKRPSRSRTLKRCFQMESTPEPLARIPLPHLQVGCPAHHTYRGPKCRLPTMPVITLIPTPIGRSQRTFAEASSRPFITPIPFAIGKSR